MRLLAAVIIGGLLLPCSYVLIVTFFSEYLFVPQYIGILSLLLVTIGCFISIEKLDRWIIRLLITLALIVLSYLVLALVIQGSLKQAIENGFIKLISLIVLFGIVGGYFRVNLLKGKLNPLPRKSSKELYDEAKIYRMNLIIRIPGVLIGTLFVFFPLFLLLDAESFEKDVASLKILELVFLISALIGTSSMGLFFLSYCIPGKTPQIILRCMENRRDKK